MEPNELLGKLTDTFSDKNDDYADTWIVTGLALSALHDEPVELESLEDHIVNGNVHRLLDKVLRGYNAAVINEGEMNYEAAQDSFEDAAVYSAMIATIVADDQTDRIQSAIENMDDNVTARLDNVVADKIAESQDVNGEQP